MFACCFSPKDMTKEFLLQACNFKGLRLYSCSRNVGLGVYGISLNFFLASCPPNPLCCKKIASLLLSETVQIRSNRVSALQRDQTLYSYDSNIE